MLRNWKGMECGARSRWQSGAMARFAATGAIVAGVMLGGGGSLSPRPASAAGAVAPAPVQVLVGRGLRGEAGVVGVIVLQERGPLANAAAPEKEPAATNEAAAKALTDAVNDLFQSGAVAPAAADAKAAADREE